MKMSTGAKERTHDDTTLTSDRVRFATCAALIALTAACSLSRPSEPRKAEAATGESSHAALFDRSPFPSATECRPCHEDHYREWSVSSHAYAQLSPVFNAMQATFVKRNNGTFGDFCIRCHTPIGMEMGEPVFAANADRSPISREGITCVVCHRMSEEFGKVNSRFVLRKGDLLEPMYGPRDGSELQRVLDSPEEFGAVVTSEGDATGRRIHSDARQFAYISQPGFCGACHDVKLPDGFRLEEAFSEYKQSPAAKRGETCQDCHMGLEPGKASGYAVAPAARVGGVPTAPRKRTNHMFVGPDYSVVHPGIYPHNPQATDLASLDEWLSFDHQSGWGTDEFEDEIENDDGFPERWTSVDDRYEAREIIDEQLALLAESRAAGTVLLRRGYVLGEIVVEEAAADGLAFKMDVRNGTDGHNVPTGFTAERLVFLQVTVVDAEGAVVFRSGDLDPNGDVRDAHSLYVHNGELPRDEQLFSLQSKFLTTNVRGSEREQVLAINESLDPLPFLRPNPMPSILAGRPAAARIHKQGIVPNGRRWAHYSVSRGNLTGKGPYRVNARLVAAMVPVNLIDAIKDVGFDYGMSARDVADAVVAGHRVLWERETVIESGDH